MGAAWERVRRDDLCVLTVADVLNESSAQNYADSIVFENVDRSHLDDHHVGQLECWFRYGRWRITALVRQDVPPATRVSFERWARERVYRLVHTDDPESDGWSPRTLDDGWQIAGA